jgi:cytosine/adenosine deaminase-related metal-dependent hydrolase
MQIDTCEADLLRDSRAVAKERGLPFTLHVSQSVTEVREMIRRHGKTPVQWADDLGLLGPGTIFGHALFLDTHSWVRWHTKSDLKLLGDSGTAVAHCPTPFARYGHVMENFGDYLRAGVTMGIGTDCSPHNLIEEMRKATVLAHIAARDIASLYGAQCFVLPVKPDTLKGYVFTAVPYRREPRGEILYRRRRNHRPVRTARNRRRLTDHAVTNFWR